MPKSGMVHPNLSVSPEITLLDRSDDSPTSLLYRAAVGPISADYYLPLLARFESAGRASLSWNWAACLYTLNWMAFRSLWGAALAYIGTMIFVPLVVLGIGRLMFQWSDTTETMLWVVWGVVGFVVPGVLGNAVLRSDLRKRMTRAITDSRTLKGACAILAAQASSRKRLIGLGVANLILVGAAVGFYLAVPEEGVLARARPDLAPARIAESGPVTDLTTELALAAANAPALVVEPASSPQATPVPPATALPVLGKPEPASLAAPALTASKAYLINVGLFAKEANARKAQATLQVAGLSPSTQEIGTGQGKRTRLRAGPFDTRAEAEAAAEKIRALKLEAQVFQP